MKTYTVILKYSDGETWCGHIEAADPVHAVMTAQVECAIANGMTECADLLPISVFEGKHSDLVGDWIAAQGDCPCERAGERDHRPGCLYHPSTAPKEVPTATLDAWDHYNAPRGKVLRTITVHRLSLQFDAIADTPAGLQAAAVIDTINEVIGKADNQPKFIAAPDEIEITVEGKDE